MALFFQVIDKEQSVLVRVNFDIVNDNMQTLQELFDQIMNQNKSNVVIDFSEVNVIDSLGLGKLLKFYQKAKQKNINLIIFGLNNQIKYLFHITQLEAIFTLAETEEDALGKI